MTGCHAEHDFRHQSARLLLRRPSNGLPGSPWACSLGWFLPTTVFGGQQGNHFVDLVAYPFNSRGTGCGGRHLGCFRAQATGALRFVPNPGYEVLVLGSGSEVNPVHKNQGRFPCYLGNRVVLGKFRGFLQIIFRIYIIPAASHICKQLGSHHNVQ